MNKKVLIIGGEGNGSIVACAIKHANLMGHSEWECAGFLNDNIEVGKKIDGFEVHGKLEDVSKFLKEGYYFINVILRIDGQKERIKKILDLGIPDDRMATFVHPMAYVSPGVKLSPGVVVMPHVSIRTSTTIGKGCIILDGATIGHDNEIGDFCHIATQACVGSFLKVGFGVHIGLNATIREHLSIGDYSAVGMGSVLTKNIGEGEVWGGNPAKFIRNVL